MTGDDSFSFNPCLKLIFTIVVRNILIQTDYIQKVYFIPNVAAYLADAFITSPAFDRLFESRKCLLIFNAIS